MTNTTLSLLIPAYNAEKFLPRLLASARAQTEPFDEIWVYDDCSTDQTAAVAEAWGAQVIRGERNKGCSAGKNALAARVNSDWLHFHDADDALLPTFGALARKWINANKHDVVLFAYECREDQTDKHIESITFDRAALEHDARAYAIRRQINPFCGLYRRQSFLDAGGYDEDPVVLYNEDSAFHIRLAFAGLRFSADDEVSIINYRVANSMSAANAKRCAVAQYHVLRRTQARADAQPYSRPIAEKLWSLSGVLGSLDAWPEAAAAAQLAARLHAPDAGSGAAWFRALASVNPVLALRIREAAIRSLKPGLRNGSTNS